MEEEPRSQQRDAEMEERARFELLLRLYWIVRSDAGAVIHAVDLGRDIGLSPVETFAVAEFLASRGYIDYLGAGPRIRIAPKGIRYIEWIAAERRTVRD